MRGDPRIGPGAAAALRLISQAATFVFATWLGGQTVEATVIAVRR